MASDAIDLEDLVPFPDAPSIVPGRPDISTLHRWRTKGVRGVRLVTVRIGGRRFVSRGAILSFISLLTAAVDGTLAPEITPFARRAAEAAERELDAKLGRVNSETATKTSPLAVADPTQQHNKAPPKREV